MISRKRTAGACAVAVLTLLAGCERFGGGQARYESADQASAALLAAVSSGDTSAVLRVLGEDAEPVVASGDPVADANTRAEFAAAYATAHRWVSETPDVSTLVVGDAEWPFPFPLVRDSDRWQFDTTNGVEEILNRRIGENELSAIQASLAYVDAQREYYWLNPEGSPLLHYARSLVSTGNRKDGLHWEATVDETESPLGSLFASARAEGYLLDSTVRPAPYYGYYFRILTAQGANAAGGAYDYVVDDQMIGGFGLIAYPAEHGSTGVMSFIVNHDGVVFSKDLGADTAKLAAEITRFDPDSSWTREEE